MKKLFNLLGLISLIITLKSVAGEYHYDNYSLDSEKWKLPRSFYFNFDDSYILDPTNEYSSITVCEDKNEYYSVKGGQFLFAIPRKGVDIGDSWDVESRQFTVKNKVNLQVLGGNYATHLIEMTTKEGLRYQYFYSKDKGLVAFSLGSLKDDSTEMYWLREHEGLGINTK